MAQEAGRKLTACAERDAPSPDAFAEAVLGRGAMTAHQSVAGRGNVGTTWVEGSADPTHVVGLRRVANERKRWNRDTTQRRRGICWGCGMVRPAWRWPAGTPNSWAGWSLCERQS